MDEGTYQKDLLALVWVHGFKGNDVTFEDFPARITRILEDTHPSLRIQSHVFPAYETRGELSNATENFVEWLATKVVQLENNEGRGRGAGSAQVVLMGHSMGGLLIADATARIAASTRDGDPLWPNVVAMLAFDTPYLGLHPHTFKHHLSQAATHVETARNIASNLAMLSPLAIGFGFGKAKQAQAEAESKEATESTRPPSSAAGPSSQTPPSDTLSSWWRAPPKTTMVGIGALALGAAAAGTAYYRREDFSTGWKWGYDHMTFVKNLWDSDALRARLDKIDELGRDRHVRFRNFYSLIPASRTNPSNRTFAILPVRTHALAHRWVPAPNTLAGDEVAAHMGMFNPRTNDGFYDLGLAVVRDIGERIEREGVVSVAVGEGGVEKDLLLEWEDEKEKGVVDT